MRKKKLLENEQVTTKKEVESVIKASITNKKKKKRIKITGFARERETVPGKLNRNSTFPKRTSRERVSRQCSKLAKTLDKRVLDTLFSVPEGGALLEKHEKVGTFHYFAFVTYEIVHKFIGKRQSILKKSHKSNLFYTFNVNVRKYPLFLTCRLS